MTQSSPLRQFVPGSSFGPPEVCHNPDPDFITTMSNSPKRPKPSRTVSNETGQSHAREWWRRVGIGAVIVMVGALAVWMAIPQDEAAAGIPEGAIATDTPTRNHVEGEIAYDEAVPPGGDHNPIWLNCGVYREPVPRENAVHSLEHGVVWITYQPELDAESISSLEEIARSRRKVIVSPVADQDSPIRLTSWGWYLEISDPDDTRIAQYLQEFEGAAYAPEPGAVCTGGIGNPA